MSILQALTDDDWEAAPWNRTLTAEDVADIRKLYRQCGWKQKDIAEQFGITQPHVSKIVNFKQWKGTSDGPV